MLTLRATVDGFDRLFRVQIERLSDLAEPLRETGKEIRDACKETFAQARARSGKQWAPLANSTEERLQNTTASPVTVHGRVRAKYIEQVSRWVQTQQKAGKYNALMGQEFYRLTHGGDPSAAVDESVKDSFKRLRRELKKTPEKRRQGKRAVTKHKLLGKIFSMIRLSVKKGALVVGILNDSPLAVHNVGGRAGHGAQEPERPFVELLASDVERFIERIQKWIVAEDET